MNRHKEICEGIIMTILKCDVEILKDLNCSTFANRLQANLKISGSRRQLLPPAAKNLFEKRFLDFPKLFINGCFSRHLFSATLTY